MTYSTGPIQGLPDSPAANLAGPTYDAGSFDAGYAYGWQAGIDAGRSAVAEPFEPFVTRSAPPVSHRARRRPVSALTVAVSIALLLFLGAAAVLAGAPMAVPLALLGLATFVAVSALTGWISR